jgi:hypothetical protein
MLVAAGGFVLVCDDVLRLNRPLGWLRAKAPSISRGRNKEDLESPRSCDPSVGFSQALEHVEGGGYSMRREEVVLDS